MPNFILIRKLNNKMPTPIISDSSFYFKTNRKLSFGDINDTILSSGSFTYNFILKRNSIGTSMIVMSKWNTTSNQRSILFRFNSTDTFQVFISGDGATSSNFVTTNTFQSTTSWYYINVVVDTSLSNANRIAVYINGTLQSGTLTGTVAAPFNSTANFIIGSDGNSASFYDGYISQVAFIQGPMQGGEISNIYNSGNPFRIDQLIDENVIWQPDFDNATYNGSTWSIPDLATTNPTCTSSNMGSDDKDNNENIYNNGYINKIIVIAGQSNASGRNPMTNLESTYSSQGYIDSMRLVDGVTSSTATFECINSSLNNNQFGETTNDFGPEFYLTDWTDSLGRDVYILKYAIGGTSLATVAQSGTASNWNIATASNLYVNLKNYIGNVQNYMSSRNKAYKFKVVIWVQGEADANNTTAGAAYYQNLTDFISGINTRIGESPNPYWFIPRYSINFDFRTDQATVRTAQATVVSDNTSERFLIDTDADAYTVLPDGIHYDAAGDRTLADALIALLQAYA